MRRDNKAKLVLEANQAVQRTPAAAEVMVTPQLAPRIKPTQCNIVEVTLHLREAKPAHKLELGKWKIVIGDSAIATAPFNIEGVLSNNILRKT